jgi:hypothetical protein
MDYLVVENICSYFKNNFTMVEVVRKCLDVDYDFSSESTVKMRLMFYYFMFKTGKNSKQANENMNQLRKLGLPL